MLSLALLIVSVLFLFVDGVWAFGAGVIPEYAYLHGDIENVLVNVAKSTAVVASLGGFLGYLKRGFLGQNNTTHKRFTRDDIKRVYFGNWLRDHSQVLDISSLKKFNAETLVMIVGVLSFLSFGFATEEYEVTSERLGVYLPVEHIDNPKGYGKDDGDPRHFDPRLRPLVRSEELEIDPRTGMKNYMATEDGNWDTSTAFIRRSLLACIQQGRRSRGFDGAELYEAYRLLGQALHTLEDLLAHSNWCEIALRKMGYDDIFCFVVVIKTPTGYAPPLVTGTFGSADFTFSLLGEAADTLSETSVVDLSQTLCEAQQANSDQILSTLKGLYHRILGGDTEEHTTMMRGQDMKTKSESYQFDPENILPKEVQEEMWELLVWRDDIYRDVLQVLEDIPGLMYLADSITESLNAFVYSTLAPYLTPVLQQVISVLGQEGTSVIQTEDEYEIFDNADASDPSHSLLSKDHFTLILNEPAGLIAEVVVEHTVGVIVGAWSDERSDPERCIDLVLEAFHHPYFNIGHSVVQNDMYTCLDRWIGGLSEQGFRDVLRGLTKEGVRNGWNKRLIEEEEATARMDTVRSSYAHDNESSSPRYPVEDIATFGKRPMSASYREGLSHMSGSVNDMGVVEGPGSVWTSYHVRELQASDDTSDVYYDASEMERDVLGH